MEKGRKEPHIEGIANHDGPESCADTREGAGEALTGVRAGWAIEPRKFRWSGVPTPSERPEGEIAGSAFASCRRTPRGQRTCACTRSLHAREPGDPTLARHGDGRAGRKGKAEAVIP
jgi:RNA-directed DNA polymerase